MMVVMVAVTVVLSNLKILSLLCLSSPCKEIMGLWKEWWIENPLTEFRILACHLQSLDLRKPLTSLSRSFFQ